MKFKRVSHDRFDEMLGILPPIAHQSKGFLVGEPWRHNDQGQPMFAPFLKLAGHCYEGDEPLTIQDFNALDVASIRAKIGHRRLSTGFTV